MILLATLAVIVGGMVLMSAMMTVDETAVPLVEQPLNMDSDAYRRAMAEMPTPLEKETCYEYALEIDRIVCLEKYETITLPYMAQQEDLSES